MAKHSSHSEGEKLANLVKAVYDLARVVVDIENEMARVMRGMPR